ncbi:MAG: hypothetical protein H7144_09160 [Burkholderiales bacterium]|nr:hypothetical protein [Phycisphaerae bacterium]
MNTSQPIGELPAPPSARSRFATRNCVAGIVVITLLVFGRLLGAEFSWWDDPHTVHHNPLLNPAKADTFAHYWQKQAANIYIPLTYTVWALLSYVARVSPGEFGISLNPWVYHAANVVTHVGGSVAAFLLFQLLIRDNRAALIGALFYAVHPVQVESVAWVSGLKDVLAGALTVAVLWQYAAYRTTGRRLNYVLAIFLYVLALLSKPSAITTPLLMGVIELLFRYRDLVTISQPWRRVFARLLPFIILAIPIAVIARSIQKGFVTISPPWARPLVMLDSIAFYLGKLVAPLGLCPDYGRNPQYIISTGQIWYTWIASAAVLIACVLLAKRKLTWPLAGLAIFIFAPLHVLGLTTFDFQSFSTTADHYLYVALLGPALVLAWLIAKWPSRLLVWAAVVLVALSAKTVVQTGKWQNELTLMHHTLEVNPTSVLGLSDLTAYYARINQLDLAKEYADRAKAREPANPLVVYNSAVTNLARRDFDSAADDFDEFIRLYDGHYGAATIDTITAYMEAADAYLSAGRIIEADKMVERARVIAPDHATIRDFDARLRTARQRQ